jgi:hypothetical protein
MYILFLLKKDKYSSSEVYLMTLLNLFIDKTNLFLFKAIIFYDIDTINRKKTEKKAHNNEFLCLYIKHHWLHK